MDLLRPLYITCSSGIIAHGILRNSVSGVSVCAPGGASLRTRTSKLHYRRFCARVCVSGALETSFPINHGGVLVCTGTSETPLPELMRKGSSETSLLEFLRTRCSRNLIPYMPWWSIGAHGNLRNSTSGISSHGILRNIIGVSAHPVHQEPHSYKAQRSIATYGNLKNSTNGVTAHEILNRNSVSGVSAHPVRQKPLAL